MATVRFSQELLHAIKRNAENQFAAELRDLPDQIPPAIGDRIYDYVMRDYQTHISALPSTLFANDDDVRCKLPSPVDAMRMNFSTSRPMFLGHTRTNKFTGDRYQWVIHDDGSTELENIQRDVVDMVSRRNQTLEKQSNFVASVMNICEAFVTLAPALKAWPPLWDLLPQETKNRHMEVKERNKTERSVGGVDLDSLTTIVVANKIRGNL
jgi:hypothetical protein